MGYYSDVCVCVAVRNKDDAERLLAIYRLDPIVGKTGAESKLKTHTFPNGAVMIYYYDKAVKWYTDYEDVRAITHLVDTAMLLEEGPEPLVYASVSVIVGEDVNDMTYDASYSPDGSYDLYDMLLDRIRLVRAIEIDL